MALGRVALGQTLSLPTTIVPESGYLSGSPLGIGVAALVLVAMTLFASWATSTADAWLEAAAPRRSPRPFTMAVLLAAVTVCAIALSELFAIDSLAVGFAQIPEGVAAAAAEGIQGAVLYSPSCSMRSCSPSP
jgi:hypothetical protein